jgi:hypothetical protein
MPEPYAASTLSHMTTKADFTEQEWDQVLSGPPLAGLVVITAEHGGTMRETFAMAKAYAEARQQHGNSELLDEIVAAKPERDHTRFHSHDELQAHAVEVLHDAVALLEAKATAQEVDDYRRFILTLARKVAERHEEDGAAISPSEQRALDDLAGALGG